MPELRKPNRRECEQLTCYLAHEMCCCPLASDMAAAEDYVVRASIAVFDNYISDCPGYCGKVMMVVWSGAPTLYEVYIWRNGVLTPVEKEC